MTLPEWALRGRAGWAHTGAARPSFAPAPRAGQESVWDYPRPPALVPDARRVMVRSGKTVVAESTRTLRLLETAHPPTFYIPREDVTMENLRAVGHGSRCEWKGLATHFDVVAGGAVLRRAAWSYEAPFGEYEALAGHVCFYASTLACFVDGDRVTPQAGGFYGGWITPELVGPFKGDPGSAGW